LDQPIAPFNVPTQYKAQRYNDANEQWEPYLPGQTAGNFFVVVPATAIAHTWTLSSSPSPLPIELLSFNAYPLPDRTIMVDWQTSSETNSLHYIVERSNGFDPFERVSQVAAAGNSSALREYHIIDRKPMDGVSYYRLRQIDIDGTEHVYDPVRVSLKNTVTKGMRIFPNPATDQVFVQRDAYATVLKLSDAKGRILKTVILDGQETIGVDIQNIPAGIYLLTDDAGNHQKLIVN
jgi:hypothetical protein